MAETKEFLGTGRRKTAVARVRLATGSGKIVINGRPFENYFPTETHRTLASRPLATTETAAKFDIRISVEGGGPNGQAGAILHGVNVIRCLGKVIGVAGEPGFRRAVGF